MTDFKKPVGAGKKTFYIKDLNWAFQFCAIK